MVFTQPPHGHAPAVAKQRGPASWKIMILAGGLVAFVAAVAVSTTLGFPSLVTGALTGLIGAWTLLIAGTRTYAVGPTWFRRANQIVHLNELTSITVDGDTVQLRDARQTGGIWSYWLRQGRCTFPLHALQDHPHLYEPLRTGIYSALTRRTVHANAAARDKFALPTTVSPTPTE